MALVMLVRNKGPPELLGNGRSRGRRALRSNCVVPELCQPTGSFLPSFPDVETATQQIDGSLGRGRVEGPVICRSITQ